MFYKKIVCLANSRKISGKCIAGKEIETGEWIRPVSNSEHGELNQSQIEYSNGEAPKLLDVIKISFKEKKTLFNQPENILITEEKWEKVGVLSIDKLDSLCDNPPTIWENNERKNDRIAEDYLKKHKTGSSLFLLKLKPEDINIKRTDYIEESETIKKKIRAVFTYNGTNYDLGITDPEIKNKYIDKTPGNYKLSSKNVYLCISLGVSSPHDHYCYKLVAAIINA